MANILEITAEQYLALCELGVPAVAALFYDTSEEEIIEELEDGGDSTFSMSLRRSWAEQEGTKFYTLIDN